MKHFDQIHLTQFIEAAQNGDRDAADIVFTAVYPELRRIAQSKLQNERGFRTLQATALAHEAWIKLLGTGGENNFQSRIDFVLAASNAMRQILVDSSRKRNAQKRGGQMERQPMESDSAAMRATDLQVLELEEALQDLELRYPVKANVVVLRYFGGMTIQETAACLEISTATVERHWAFARAWLKDCILGEKKMID